MSVHMLPAAPGNCQVCATKHDPSQPHNAHSFPYGMWFQLEYGRDPTWADAVAHCTEEVAMQWKEQLKRIGRWTEPKDGKPIATVDKSGGVPVMRKLKNMEPVTVSMRKGKKDE